MNLPSELKTAIEFYRARASTMRDTLVGDSTCVYGQHWPFDDYKYKYAKIVNGRNDPGASHSLDKAPMACGTRGPGSLAAWDTALLRPTSTVRGKSPVVLQKLPTVKKTNPEWEEVAAQLRRSGPLGPDRDIIRPKGRWIVDLMTDRQGEEMFDLALALAHLRGDRAPNRNKYPFGGPVANLLPQCVAEVALARRTGLPLRLTDDWVTGAVPGLPHGIAVITDTGNPVSPTMLVPTGGPGCPVPDQTLTCVLASVVYQSVPYALSQGLSRPGPWDQWACTPTLVAFAGFEHVDYITHAELVIPHPEYRGSPYYGVHAQDLLPMDSLRHCIYLCQDQNVLQSDREAEWLEFGSYEVKELLSRSPVWPTKEAFHMPRSSSVAPERPAGRVSSKADLARPEQQRWLSTVDHAFKLVSAAVEREAKMRTSLKEFKSERAARRKGWAERKRENNLKTRIEHAIWADRLGRTLSDRQASLLRSVRKEKGDQFAQYTKTIIETTECPYEQ